MILKSNRELKCRYHELSGGDVFSGNLSLKHLKQTLFIDMLEQGIRCLPSALSQILNSSKVAQAFILRDWMLPFTFVILRRADLIEAINAFNNALIFRPDDLATQKLLSRAEERTRTSTSPT